MADVMQSSAVMLGFFGDAFTFPGHIPTVGFEQTSQHPQQAGLTASIRADQHQGVTGINWKIESFKNEALATQAGQVMAGKICHDGWEITNLFPKSNLKTLEPVPIDNRTTFTPLQKWSDRVGEPGRWI